MSIRRPPQRLRPPSPPGVLLKRVFAVAQRLKLRATLPREPDYLAQVRELPCLRCGMDPCGEAAHVRMQSGAHGKRGGIGKTPADRWAVPLCGSCHREDPDAQHRVGELAFWHGVGVNPLLTCSRLYAAKGDPVRMRAITLLAIAERMRS